MPQSVLRFAILIPLCLLLVFAPEIVSSLHPSLSSPAHSHILRVTLHPQDRSTAKTMNDALTIYMKEHPSIHLRIAYSDTTHPGDPLLSAACGCDLSDETREILACIAAVSSK